MKFLNIKNNYFVIFLLISLSILTYWRVPFLFFQQDEWMVFGLLIDRGTSVILRGLGNDQTFHFVPVDWVINYSLFHLFRLNNIAYNVLGLSLHLLNAILVYLIAKRLLKNSLGSLIACIFFITSSVAAQLIMWPVANLNTLSLTLSLLIWLLIIRFNNTKTLTFSIVISLLTLLSLFAIEYSVGLFLFIPVVYVLQNRKHSKSFLKFFVPFLIVLILYLTIRIYPLAVNIQTTQVNNISTPSAIVFKISRYPLRYLGQLFISQYSTITILRFAEQQLPVDLVGKIKSNESIAFTKISFGIGLILLLMIFLIFRKIKKISFNYSLGLLMALIFIFTSAIPFVFIPGQAGDFLIIPPRYLYSGLAGMAVILAFFVEYIFLRHSFYLKIIVLGGISVLILLSISQNLEIANNLWEQGEERKRILTTIKAKYPKIADKTVFYTRSDRSYYGFPESELILPFQSGFGQTLLVWYYFDEKFPKEFFQNRFLWEITDQGYKEINGRGFGYFRDIEKMGQTLNNQQINKIKFIAFNFDSQNYQLSDISEEVKGELNGYLANKQLINQWEFFIQASENYSKVNLMIDNDRDTFWQSNLPYDKQQIIEFNLQSSKKVAQISIDSYNDKNQGKVGYEIYLSDNGQEWDKVFTAKQYPPNDQGIVNIYFQPKMSRYVKIKQIGTHQFANWVINEVKLYETID